MRPTEEQDRAKREMQAAEQNAKLDELRQLEATLNAQPDPVGDALRQAGLLGPNLRGGPSDLREPEREGTPPAA
jgi:hypothetical protein